MISFGYISPVSSAQEQQPRCVHLIFKEISWWIQHRILLRTKKWLSGFKLEHQTRNLLNLIAVECCDGSGRSNFKQHDLPVLPIDTPETMLCQDSSSATTNLGGLSVEGNKVILNLNESRLSRIAWNSHSRHFKTFQNYLWNFAGNEFEHLNWISYRTDGSGWSPILFTTRDLTVFDFYRIRKGPKGIWN